MPRPRLAKLLVYCAFFAGFVMAMPVFVLTPAYLLYGAEFAARAWSHGFGEHSAMGGALVLCGATLAAWAGVAFARIVARWLVRKGHLSEAQARTAFGGPSRLEMPPAHLTEDKSWMRRLARPLIRAALLALAGLYFVVVAAYLRTLAGRVGLPSADLTDLTYLPTASVLSGVALAFVPSRYRRAGLATAAAGILLWTIFLARS